MVSDHAETNLRALRVAIATGISAWAAVENQLHQLFGIATSLVVMQPGGGYSYDTTVPSAVLDSIDGFYAKILMIDAALTASLTNLDEAAAAIQSDWRAERTRVRALHRNRNRLAHWGAHIRISLETGHEMALLTPPQYSSHQHQGVTQKDIEQWTENFHSENQRLGELAERLASHRGLQERHLARTAEQLRVCLPDDEYLLAFLQGKLNA